MSLVIDAPVVEGKLRREAQRRGLSAADLAATILSAHLGPAQASETEAAPFYATATPEQWIAEFDTWVDSHAGGRSLPDSALTRESFYEGRA